MNDLFYELIMLDTASLEGVKDSAALEKYRKKYFELLDVVDEEGKIIGAAPRGFIHRCGLRHRAVHLIIFNTAGQFLLQRRGMEADNKPGRLDISAAGHVKAGETDFKVSALREIEEELGFACSQDRLKLVNEYNRNTPFNITKPYVRNCEYRILFSYEMTADESDRLEKEFANRTSKGEVFGLGWFSIEEVVKILNLGHVADGLVGSFTQFLSIHKM